MYKIILKKKLQEYLDSKKNYQKQEILMINVLKICMILLRKIN